MKKLTPELLAQIAQAVKQRHAALVVKLYGGAALPAAEVKKLEALGLIKPGTAPILEDAYLLGQVAAKLEDPAVWQWTPQQWAAYLAANPVPLSPAAQQAVVHASLSGATYVTGLGNVAAKETAAVVIGIDKAQEHALKTTISEKTAESLAQRNTNAQLKSELGHATKDWSRNFDRIAITETHAAAQQGFADAVVEKHGPGALVAVQPAPDACPVCKKLHLGPDGTPRIVPLSALAPHGANVGKPSSAWVATLPPVHPHCLTFRSRVTTSVGTVPIWCVYPGRLVLGDDGTWHAVKAVWTNRYSGTMVTLTLSNGRKLECTPEHPISVHGVGWVPAGAVQKGAEVTAVVDELGTASHAMHVPPVADEGGTVAYVYLARVGTELKVVVHVDGHFFVDDAEVEAQGSPALSFEHNADVHAGAGGQEQPVQRLLSGRFELRGAGGEVVPDFDDAHVLQGTSGRFLRVTGELDRTLTRAAYIWRELEFIEPAADGLSGNTQSSRDVFRRCTALMARHDGSVVEFLPRTSAHGSSPVLFGNLVVVDSQKSEVNDVFVYNLTVEDASSFVANGVVTHNCQCQVLHVPAGWGFDESGKLMPGGPLGVKTTDLAKAMREEEELQAEFRKGEVVGRMTFRGLPIAVENEPGSVRHWFDVSAQVAGTTLMRWPYGFIEGTIAADGEEVDVYVGPDPSADEVYVVHQRKKLPEGGFGGYDEDKVFLGFSSATQAKAAYLQHMNDEGFYGSMSVLPWSMFLEKLRKRGAISALFKAEDPTGLVIKSGADLQTGSTWRNIPEMSKVVGLRADYVEGRLESDDAPGHNVRDPKVYEARSGDVWVHDVEGRDGTVRRVDPEGPLVQYVIPLSPGRIDVSAATDAMVSGKHLMPNDGDEVEKAGPHKYTTKKWSVDHWVYTYADSHGGKVAPHHSEKDTFVLKLPKEKAAELEAFRQKHNLPGSVVIGGQNAILAITDANAIAAWKKHVQAPATFTLGAQAQTTSKPDGAAVAAKVSAAMAASTQDGAPKHITLSPEFKGFFGDWLNDPASASKVVGKDGLPEEQFGKPQVLYHGTPVGGFSSFSKEKDKGHNIFGKGFYFTADKGIATEYTKKDAATAKAAMVGLTRDGAPVTTLSSAEADSLIAATASDNPHTAHPLEAAVRVAVLYARNADGTLDVGKFIQNFWKPPVVLGAKGTEEKLVADGMSPADAKRLGSYLVQPLSALYDGGSGAGAKMAAKLEQVTGASAVVPDAQVFEVYLAVKNPVDMDAVMPAEEFASFAEFTRKAQIPQAIRNIESAEKDLEYEKSPLKQKMLDDYVSDYQGKVAKAKEALAEHVKARGKKKKKSWEEEMAESKLAEAEKGLAFHTDAKANHAAEVAKKEGYVAARKKELEDLQGPPSGVPLIHGVYLDSLLGFQDHKNLVGRDASEPHSLEDFQKIKDALKSKTYTTKDSATGKTVTKKVMPIAHVGDQSSGKLTWGDFHWLMSNGHQDGGGIRQHFTEWAQKRGYDGIHHTGGWNIGSHAHDVWIAFEPTQIKATTAKVFDAKDSDIYKADGSGGAGHKYVSKAAPPKPKPKPVGAAVTAVDGIRIRAVDENTVLAEEV